MKNLCVFLFVFCSQLSFSRGNSSFEKSSANAFSVYSRPKDAYLYNPSVLAYNNKQIFSPLALTATVDKAAYALLKNYAEYSKLKGKGLADKIESLSGQNPYLSSDLVFSALFRNMQVVFRGEVEAILKPHKSVSSSSDGLNLNLSDSVEDSLPSLEIVTMESLKLYFSHGFMLKDFAFGYTVKPNFVIARQDKKNLLRMDQDFVNSHKNGTKKVELSFTVGGNWKKKIHEQHVFSVGTTFNNFGFRVARFNPRSDLTYEADSFSHRLGAGFISKFRVLKLKTKLFSTFETNYFDSFSHHLGLSLNFINLIDLRCGLDNLAYTWGAFLVHDIVELGVSSYELKSRNLMNDTSASRVLSVNLGLYIPF